MYPILFNPFCERLGVFSQASAFAECHPKMFFFFFSKRSGFLIISPYQLVCALMLRDNKKGVKRYKNIFRVVEIIKNA
jgi:hypothetical protein